jgi:hypothetical protein
MTCAASGSFDFAIVGESAVSSPPFQARKQGRQKCYFRV